MYQYSDELDEVLKYQMSEIVKKIKNKEELKTLKQNGRRDAAKGAFKTDAESNNKSLPSLPPSLTYQKP